MNDKKIEYRGFWDIQRQYIIGLGEMKFGDGTIYQGQIANKTFHGKGRMTRPNGDIYQGDYVNGEANGHGVFVDAHGSVYDGQWRNDKQHGHGVEHWYDDGLMRYEGDYTDGHKTGYGKFEFEGNTYEGQFKDGKFHGQGKYFFADSGKIYRGSFEDNRIHGKGIMIYPDGTMYNGEFKFDKLDGYGVMQSPNGNRYMGTFKDDMKEGNGIWVDISTQTKRQGTWVKDKRVNWSGAEIATTLLTYGQLHEHGEFMGEPEMQDFKGANGAGRWKRVSKILTPQLQGAKAFRKSAMVTGLQPLQFAAQTTSDENVNPVL